MIYDNIQVLTLSIILESYLETYLKDRVEWYKINDKSFIGDTLVYNIDIKPFAPISYINLNYSVIEDKNEI
jgi:hypothetical protein